MKNTRQDNTNEYVVLNKAINLIEDSYSIYRQDTTSYLSDRVVYLNSFLCSPEEKIPKHVFRSAYNLINPEIQFMIITRGRNVPNRDHLIKMEVAAELKRIADESDK